MGFNWKQFANVAISISSVVLPMVNPALAPLASVIGHAIGEAEQIPGASSQQKLDHVKSIVATVASSIPGIDANEVSQSLEEGIDTVVAATNVVVKKPV